jgi:hypothetical protein
VDAFVTLAGLLVCGMDGYPSSRDHVGVARMVCGKSKGEPIHDER